MPPLASEIFAKILFDKDILAFKGDPVTLHKLFFQLYQRNPEIMDCFQFIKRINPYSPTLDHMIQLFQLTGAIERKNPDFVEYYVNRETLKKYLEGEISPMDINGIDLIDDIIIKKMHNLYS